MVGFTREEFDKFFKSKRYSTQFFSVRWRSLKRRTGNDEAQRTLIKIVNKTKTIRYNYIPTTFIQILNLDNKFYVVNKNRNRNVFFLQTSLFWIKQKANYKISLDASWLFATLNDVFYSSTLPIPNNRMLFWSFLFP